MIIDIDGQTLSVIRNPRFRPYAAIYLNIYQDFLEQVKRSGIEIDPHTLKRETADSLVQLRRKGAICRNADKSIYVNRISPACVACQTGVGSATFFISLMCNRKCWFCFNPNQEKFEYFSRNQRDCVTELDLLYKHQHKIRHLALTGGEPLLHKESALEFFRYAHEKFPGVYTRLYTDGDFVDAKVLMELQSVHLSEIRFSIRIDDGESGRRSTLDKIALARDYVPHVMVEMPVLPGTGDRMKEILLELDRLGIFSINLLELCFPFNNARAFQRRDYRIKNPPFRILYTYWYAGGLPISRSELECLDLLEFVLDAGLQIGVHYCSLENKHTGQIFQQNVNQRIPETSYLSEKDFFLKSAKVFGRDAPKVRKRFQEIGYKGYTENREHAFIEFHVGQIRVLQGLDIEVGVSSSVIETRGGEQYLRELKVDLTYPEVFDIAADV
jgi:pyruvate formate-lyase activating enzyme-like uncharacterized protein